MDPLGVQALDPYPHHHHSWPNPESAPRSKTTTFWRTELIPFPEAFTSALSLPLPREAPSSQARCSPSVEPPRNINAEWKESSLWRMCCTACWLLLSPLTTLFLLCSGPMPENHPMKMQVPQPIPRFWLGSWGRAPGEATDHTLGNPACSRQRCLT